MKPRSSSTLLAVAFLVLGGTVIHVAPKFRDIYAELFAGAVVLPVPTLLVLGLAPTGWTLLSIAIAVLILSKDLHPIGRRFPNWPFAGLLALAIAFVTAALFMPLMAEISGISTPEEPQQTLAGEFTAPPNAAAQPAEQVELPSPPPAP